MLGLKLNHVSKRGPQCLGYIASNNVFPLITKPTRVTENTATLIDHILTNTLDIASEHEQGCCAQIFLIIMQYSI